MNYSVEYNRRRREAKELVAAIDQKIQQKQEKVGRLEKSIESLRAKRKKVPVVSWIDEFAKPVGKALADRLGKSYEVLGPFGIRAATIIYLMDDPQKGICKQDALSITITPTFDENGDMVFCYDTGKTTDRYRPDTIGAINGCNNIEAPLPDEIKEIEKLLIEHKYRGEIDGK